MDLAGFTIHDPDVAFTDLGLAVLGGYFAVRLGLSAGGVLMGALASAALWGGVYHGFFPAGTTTRAGLVLWLAVVVSIVLASATLVDLSLRTLVPRVAGTVRNTVLGGYAAAFIATALLVDHSFRTVVLFYGPALGLFLLVSAARAAVTRNAGWMFMAAGLASSVVAALVQQMKVMLHPVYFDHNALYHVVQGGALVLIFLGFQLTPDLKGEEHVATNR